MNDSAFINIYNNSIKDISNQEWLKISVSGHESIFASKNADLLVSMVKGAKYIDIIRLDDAPLGTCIIETQQGVINSSVDIQLSKINDAFSKLEE